MKCPSCNHEWDLKPEGKFDFEAIYKIYPRKQGKLNGIKKCIKQIRSQKDYDDLKKAIHNFKDFHIRRGTEPSYIQHFSTFISTWQEWLLPETGKVELTQKKETNEEYIAKRKEKEDQEIGWEESDPAKVREILDRALGKK